MTNKGLSSTTFKSPADSLSSSNGGLETQTDVTPDSEHNPTPTVIALCRIYASFGAFVPPPVLMLCPGLAMSSEKFTTLT